MENYLEHNPLLSDLERMVIEDMYEKGFNYPYITIEQVQAFWAMKGIK